MRSSATQYSDVLMVMLSEATASVLSSARQSSGLCGSSVSWRRAAILIRYSTRRAAVNTSPSAMAALCRLTSTGRWKRIANEQRIFRRVSILAATSLGDGPATRLMSASTTSFIKSSAAALTAAAAAAFLKLALISLSSSRTLPTARCARV